MRKRERSQREETPREILEREIEIPKKVRYPKEREREKETKERKRS